MDFATQKYRAFAWLLLHSITGTAYNMISFNTRVLRHTTKKFNLKRYDAIVFSKLLGFLIRNDKPFPYSATKISENCFCSLRTVFNSLNKLESLNLIVRSGFGFIRKFQKGNELINIISTMQYERDRVINEQVNNCSTTQYVHSTVQNVHTRKPREPNNKTVISKKLSLPENGSAQKFNNRSEFKLYSKNLSKNITKNNFSKNLTQEQIQEIYEYEKKLIFLNRNMS